MEATKTWRQALAEDHRIIATAQSEDGKYTIYRSHDRTRYVIHRRKANGDSVYWCRSLSELLGHLRTFLTLGPLVEVGHKVTQDILSPA